MAPSAFMLQDINKHHDNTSITLNDSQRSESLNSDDLTLARLGKKPVLKRNFGLVSMIGFSCGLMCTWEGVLTNLFTGYQNGGPGGLIIGFLFNWAGVICTFLAIGELSSMYPTAGGQYHWVGILAPPSHRKFLSYITGWLAACGWLATYAITGYVVSGLILSIVSLTHPGFEATGWQGTFCFWAVLLLATVLNTVFSSFLPYLEVFVLIFHVIGFVAFVIPVIYLSEHNTSAEVFSVFVNGGNWYTTGFAVLIGLNGNAGAFVGTDGPVHMSEEVQNAEKSVARSMVVSLVLNGALAFAVLLAVLYVKVDYSSVADSDYPFVLIVAHGTQSLGAGITSAVVVVILQFAACVGALASCSRIVWSMARDRALPRWEYLRRINKATTIPLTAIITIMLITMALGLINIGSETVFDAFISLLLEALFLSYLIALGILLSGRISGRIGSDPDSLFHWGPWRIPGVLGTLNNILACVYLVVICFFAFWPSSLPVTPDTMNFSVVVTGAVLLFSSLYYLIWARKVYDGPLKEIDVD